MAKKIHAAAGLLAMLTLMTFWSSTLISELFLGEEAVPNVKSAIVKGLFILVPALAATGISGVFLARSRSGGGIATKTKRMKVLAANGLIIMIPAALYLNSKAAIGEFDAAFYVVQVVELATGLIQMVLMTLNFRTGLRMSGRL